MRWTKEKAYVVQWMRGWGNIDSQIPVSERRKGGDGEDPQGGLWNQLIWMVDN